MKVHGADISHYQASVDLAKAKRSGLQFLYHKVSEGTTYLDSTYAKHRKEAKAAGLPFGGYHFAQPGSDPVKQAQFFVRNCSPQPGDLRPALDLESQVSGVNTNTWATAFLKEVRRLTGVDCVVYSPFSLAAFSGHTMWVPRYNNSNTPPTQRWDIWQFSNGVVGDPDSFPGLGHTDLNTFHEGVTLSDILIPVTRKTTIQIQHTSMEKEDTKAQKQADARKAFSLGSDVISFTEVGRKENRVGRRAVIRQAKARGYRLFLDKYDCGVAVRLGKVVDHGYELFLKGTKNDHPNVGLNWVTCEHPDLGRLTFGVFHGLTKGRQEAALARWAVDLLSTKGADVAFLAGDVNVDDALHQVVPTGWTTCWDELKTYPDTLGKATFDVVASFDGDGRVKCVGGHAVQMNSNHSTIVVAYQIGHVG